MKLEHGSPRAASAGALALAAAGSALWVEHRSRQAERRHHAPHRIVYVGDTRVHYSLHGEGPPVLLVHGNLVHGADFEASGLVERLARSHQVIVVDRPGFGWSDRPRGLYWTPAEQARLLRHALSVLGIRQPVVVGHSMGTQVALCMALQQPSSVAGLVLAGGYYFPGVRLDRWMAAAAATPVLGDVMRYTSSYWTARMTLPASLRAMFSPHPVPERFREALPAELLLRPLQQRATAEDGARMVRQARAMQARYEGLQLPVALFAGARDRVVTPRQSERLHAVLPRSELQLVPDAGHMVHHLAQDAMVQAVEAMRR